MLLHYLKISFRQITSSPVFAFVNLIGLVLGYFVLIVLWPYCQSELDGDVFIKDHERIARSMVIWQWTDDGGRTFGERLLPQSPGSFSVGMTGHPEVQEVTRFAPQPWFTNANTPGLKDDLVLETGKNDDRLIQLEKTAAICADENFIRFFSFPMLVGDPV